MQKNIFIVYWNHVRDFEKRDKALSTYIIYYNVGSLPGVWLLFVLPLVRRSLFFSLFFFFSFLHSIPFYFICLFSFFFLNNSYVYFSFLFFLSWYCSLFRIWPFFFFFFMQFMSTFDFFFHCFLRLNFEPTSSCSSVFCLTIIFFFFFSTLSSHSRIIIIGLYLLIWFSCYGNLYCYAYRLLMITFIIFHPVVLFIFYILLFSIYFTFPLRLERLKGRGIRQY